MKIKGAISLLAAMAILSTGGTAAMAEGDTQTTANTTVSAAVSTTTVTAEKNVPITADTIKGTWKGSFLGYESGKMVPRETVLNIDECSDDGKFSGLLEVTSVENESYFFEGTCDFKTGKFSFNGIDWKINENNWSIYKFNGTVDAENKTLSGTRNNDSKSTFSFEKYSDEFDSLSIDLSKIRRSYYGEYAGFTTVNGKAIPVKRNILISISEIDEDGKINGYAKFTPSPNADSKYALVGSYNFKGTIDKRFGRIKFQGNEWIDYPKDEDDNSSFQMIPFSGAIHGDYIEGGTEYGIWKMESSDILKGDLNFDNALNIADLLILDKHLLNTDILLNKTIFYTADMNDDSEVDVFDLIELRKAVIKFASKEKKIPD